MNGDCLRYDRVASVYRSQFLRVVCCTNRLNRRIGFCPVVTTAGCYRSRIYYIIGLQQGEMQGGDQGITSVLIAQRVDIILVGITDLSTPCEGRALSCRGICSSRSDTAQRDELRITVEGVATVHSDGIAQGLAGGATARRVRHIFPSSVYVYLPISVHYRHRRILCITLVLCLRCLNGSGGHNRRVIRHCRSSDRCDRNPGRQTLCLVDNDGIYLTRQTIDIRYQMLMHLIGDRVSWCG